MRDILTNFFGKNIIANIYKSILFKGLTIIGQLYLIPLTIDILDKESYGIWIVITTLINWITFFDFGVGNGLRNKLVESEVREDHDLSKKYITSTYVFIAYICIVLGCLYYLINHFYPLGKLLLGASYESTELGTVLNISVFLFLIRFWLMTINYINYALQKSGINDILQFCNIGIIISCFLVLKNRITFDLFSVVLIYSVIPIIVYLFYSVFFFKRKVRFIPSIKAFDIKVVRSLMNLGFSFFFIQIVATLLFTLPIFLIGKWYGATSVTDFNIANKLYGVIYMGLSIILVPYWSAYAKATTVGDIAWLKTTIRKMQKLSFAFAILSMLIYCLSPFIYEIWIGNEINISGHINLSAALYNLSLILLAPLNYYLNGISKLNFQVRLSWLNLVLYLPIVCLFTIVFKLDSVGIVYTSVFILSLNYIVTFVYVNRSLHVTDSVPA